MLFKEIIMTDNAALDNSLGGDYAQERILLGLYNKY